MHRAIVVRRVRAIFAALNRGETGPLLAGLTEPARHSMNGDHALSGSRSTVSATREWYARLLRLLPDLHFELDAIAVAGPPWRTIVTVTWRDQALSGRYHNEGVHVIELRGTRVRSVAIHCDSQRLAEVLRELAAAGVAEARALPVLDAAAREPARLRQPAARDQP